MKLIFLNHKMNLTNNEVKVYIEKLNKVKNELIVLPSSIYVKEFIDSGFTTGLQNIYFEDKGAYTGEISPHQAKELGAKYVLIGHSERRELFFESDAIINKKIKRALENELNVILCVGEKEGENAKEVLHRQITNALKDVNGKVIISYEPVYAIGTGIIPPVEAIEEKINYIKSLVNTKVLYGGSVNKSNINALNKIENIDGFLIGGASLNPEELLKILEVVC